MTECELDVSQKGEKQIAFTLYSEFIQHMLHPTGKWIFLTSFLKRLIAFIVSVCLAFIDCLKCQSQQLLVCAFYLL